MKIITPGELPGKKIMRVTCRNCGCKFEFEADEAVLKLDQRDGDYYQITCPTKDCHTACTVSYTAPKIYG